MTATRKPPKLIHYVVLRRGETPDTWVESLQGDYTDPMAAKKAGATKDGSGTYVAIAKTSWTPDPLVGRQMTVWEVAPQEPAVPVEDAVRVEAPAADVVA